MCGGDAHHARRRSLSRPDTGFRGFEVADQLYGRLVEVSPRLSETKAAGSAHEQLRPETFLKRRHLLADGWLAVPSSRATAEKLPLSTTRAKILMPSSRSIRPSRGGRLA